jgi:hypothetical protein
MNAHGNRPRSSKDEDKEESPQSKQLYETCITADAHETSQHENAFNESCNQQIGDGSDKICATGSTLINTSWETATEQSLGRREGKRSATPRKQRSSKGEDKEASPQSTQANGSHVITNVHVHETSQHKIECSASCDHRIGDGHDEMCATSSTLIDNSWRTAPKKSLGRREGKLGGTPRKQRSRSPVETLPIKDNTVVGNENKEHDASTTHPPHSALWMSLLPEADSLQTSRLSQLSHLAQAHEQRNAQLLLNTSLPNPHSVVAASAAPLTAITGFPHYTLAPQLTPSSALHSSLIEQSLPLSHIAQAHAQRNARLLNTSLPIPHSVIAASAAPLTAIAGFPHYTLAPQLTPSSALHSSLIEQALIAQRRTGFSLDSLMPTAASQEQSQASSLTATFLGQLQLESIAQMTDGARIPLRQIPAHQAPSSAIHRSPLLVQMGLASVPLVSMTVGSPQQQSSWGASQVYQSSYLPLAQSATALTREHLFRQLSDSQNSQVVPNARQTQYQRRALQIMENSRITEHVTALLMLEQQAGGTNTFTPRMTLLSANQRELFLRSFIANFELNLRSTQGMATTAAASAFHHSLPNFMLNNSNDKGFCCFQDTSSDDVDPQEHSLVPNYTKEKRWMIRYEELIQFRQVRDYSFAPTSRLPFRSVVF